MSKAAERGKSHRCDGDSGGLEEADREPSSARSACDCTGSGEPNQVTAPFHGRTALELLDTATSEEKWPERADREPSSARSACDCTGSGEPNQVTAPFHGRTALELLDTATNEEKWPERADREPSSARSACD